MFHFCVEETIWKRFLKIIFLWILILEAVLIYFILFILFCEPYFWMLFFLSTESKETSEILYWCIQIYGGAEVSHLVKFGVCLDDKFQDAVWKMKSEDIVFIQEKTVRKMLSSKEVNVKIYLLCSDYLLCICYISISIHLGNRIS